MTQGIDHCRVLALSCTSIERVQKKYNVHHSCIFNKMPQHLTSHVLAPRLPRKRPVRRDALRQRHELQQLSRVLVGEVTLCYIYVSHTGITERAKVMEPSLPLY